MDNNTDKSQLSKSADSFIESSHSQMRKGVLAYGVLLLCSKGRIYSSEIIQQLRTSDLIVVEGTLYPLLSRLAKDGVLGYEWQESEFGPPRKYYWLTDEGKVVMQKLAQVYKGLQASISKLERGTK